LAPIVTTRYTKVTRKGGAIKTCMYTIEYDEGSWSRRTAAGWVGRLLRKKGYQLVRVEVKA
jgi:hypothetical protein